MIERLDGSIVGLTRGTTKAHIARAALESIALQVMDVLKAMEADAKIRLKELRVDGGASANDLLMQLQADLLGVPVVRPRVSETTALGAAYLAGLAVGYWKSQAIGGIGTTAVTSVRDILLSVVTGVKDVASAALPTASRQPDNKPLPSETPQA